MASRGLVSGEICPKHCWEFIHPLASSHFQSFLQYGLDYLVHCFHLPVCLRVSHCCETLVDAIFVVEIFELPTLELSSIVSNNGLWKPETEYDVAYKEIDDFLCSDRCQWFCFCPLGEVVDCHNCILCTAFRDWQGAYNVDSPHCEWSWTDHLCKFYRRCSRDLCILLEFIALS